MADNEDCGCGKGGTPPLGKPTPPRAGGSLAANTQSFTAKTQSFVSTLEARAAAVRSGGPSKSGG